MVWRAIMFLGLRMARRNHFHLFAWLCAIAVPAALQLITYYVEELRDQLLGGYYGVLSLYMFFALTFGFGAVFASYYITSYYRRREALDALALTQVRPWQMLAGVYAAVEAVLVPPALAFCLGILCYGLVTRSGQGGSSLGGLELAGLAFVVLMNQAVLAATVTTGLLGRINFAALAAVFMMLQLNALPVMLLYVFHWPVVAYLAIMVGLLLVMLFLALTLLRFRWPPVALSLRERSGQHTPV